MSRLFEGAHEISVHELKGRTHDGVLGFVVVIQLMTFSKLTELTVCHKSVKCDAIAVLPVHELKAALV